MSMMSRIQKLFQSEQGELQPAPQVRILPLPCPVHACAFIPEAEGNGKFGFYCPLCRLACQPVEKASEQPQEGPEKTQRTGTLLHMRNTRNRFIERLSANAKNRKLVLPNPKFLNSSAGDRDLLFSDTPTELVPAILRRTLPDVG